jgi:hypothetical protein
MLFCTSIFIGYGEENGMDVSNNSTMMNDLVEMNSTEEPTSEDFSLPFSGFIENQGQINNTSICYYFAQNGMKVGFGFSDIVFIGEKESFTISFPESNMVSPIGVNKKAHVVNYIYGDFQKSNIPTYDMLWFYDLYDGIDLRYFMSETELKYEFIVHPGADPSSISIEVSDTIDLAIVDNSVSFYSTDDLLFKDTGLTVYQKDQLSVDACFTSKDTKSNVYGFKVDKYDQKQDLIIDPWILAFSSFFGRTKQDRFYDVEVDSAGNVYAAGYTYGSFPILNHFQTFQYPPDGIIVKVDSECNLLFSTYLGGSVGSYAAWDYIYGLDVDDDGYVYVCGRTDSSDFPTKNAFNATEPWGTDGFVTKLNYTGSSLVYSTYFGGNVYEICWDIEVDSSGCAYVTGYTSSTNFPLKNAYNSTPGGDDDVFISKFTAAGNDLVFSTLLGGSGEDQGRGITVDTSGNCYVTGYTRSTDFTTKNAYDSSMNGWKDVFMAKYNSDGSNLLFSTFLGGSGENHGWDIDVDSNQRIYVCGYTTSSSFPTANGYDTTYGGGKDIFLTKFEADGSLNYSSYFGGDGNDEARGITVGPDDKPYITGVVNSTGYPMANPYDSELGGYQDTFITKLNEEGDSLEFSSYIGGSQYEWGYGVAVDSDHNIYLSGITGSTDYPTVRAYQSTYGGDYHDAYLTKLVFDNTPPSIDLNSPEDGSTIRYGMTIDLDITDDWYIDLVLYNWDGNNNNSLSEPYDIIVPPTSSSVLNIYVNDTAGNEVSATFTFVRSTSWMAYSSFLGGSSGGNSARDWGRAVTLDEDGNSYFVGITESTNFPTLHPFNDTNSGDYDIFLSKFSKDGTLLFSTYIGGSQLEEVYDVEVDSAGNIYLCGYTESSTDFPILNAQNSTFGGGAYDAYLMKMNSTGTGIIFSSFLGGEDHDRALALELDEVGNIYVTGYTYSYEFPTVSGYCDTKGGLGDVFLSKYNPSGQDLLYSTFIGGDAYEAAWGLDIDSEGYCYLVGQTFSTNYPLQNAMNSSKRGMSDIIITKIKPGQPSLNYSTYFGCMSDDCAMDVVVDSTGVCYFLGWASSGSYPIKNEIQTYQGSNDLVITAINYTGANCLWSTYLGTSGGDGSGGTAGWVGGISLGPDGHVHVVSKVGGTGLPVENPYDSLYNGGNDVVLAKLTLDGNDLEFCSYLGAADDDEAYDIAVHTDGTMCIVGTTASSEFPVLNAYQDTFAGVNNDAFITRIGIDDAEPLISLSSPLEGLAAPSGTEVILSIEDSDSGISLVRVNWDGALNQTLESPYTESLPIGEGPHTLHVYVRDNVGHWASDSYLLHTDDTEPVITLVSPVNNTIQQSSIIIDIDVDDLYLDKVMHAWDDDDLVELGDPYYTSPATPDGTHILHIIAYDLVGRDVHAYYVFTTDDTLPQIILPYPLNNTAHHSDTKIDFSIFDLHLDDVLFNWDSSSNSTWNEPYVTLLPAGSGSHILRVYANDSVGNRKFMLLNFITDDTLPGISYPSDVTMDEGETGRSISWIPTSPDPYEYTIYRNGSELVTDSWISEEPIIISLDNVPYGFYNYTIIIQDGVGNSERDWVWVDVVDNTVPVINDAKDIICDHGSTGHSIVWNGTDVNPVSYRVFRNGTLYASGLWNDSSEFFVINIDGLSLGVYEFAMIIKDVDGNTAADIVHVTVADLTPPLLEELDDFAYVVDTTGYELEWDASDRNPTSYEIFRNGTSLGSFPWDGSPIIVSIDGLEVGIYNYTIRVLDIGNNQAVDEVWVSVVVDVTPPIIDNPPNTYYHEGTTGNNITWVPDDEFPDHYEIYRNGTLIELDDWNPEDENITISIDGLPEGVYNFTIIVYDDGGNNATHTIWVEVVNDTTAPELDHPDDFSYNEGTSGHVIIWTPYDLYPSEYIVSRNGTEIEYDDWNGSVIVITIDGLAAGKYYYFLTVFDVGGNNISDTVWVTVFDVTSPEIDTPDDLSYAEGTTGNSITWAPTDLHPASYTVLQNGTELESDEWSGGIIVVPIDGLSLGNYNYTIIVEDESGNKAMDTVLVRIYDGTPPTIDNPGDIGYEEGETGN